MILWSNPSWYILSANCDERSVLHSIKSPYHPHHTRKLGIVALECDGLLNSLPIDKFGEAYFDLILIVRGLALSVLVVLVGKTHPVGAPFPKIKMEYCGCHVFWWYPQLHRFML